MTADEPGDGDLVCHALAGEQKAYRDLVKRHQRAVYTLACTYIGDADEARDITQESFISAFLALPRFDTSRSFRAWLARIAINKCRDWARKRRVRQLLSWTRPLSDAVQVADGKALPHETMAASQDLERLRKAITRLPATLKEPLLLCTVEGHSQSEAAQILRISEKAVETRIYRARARLAAAMEEKTA